MTEKRVIRIKRRAAREIDAAAEWWSIHRPAAPGAIRIELETAFELILQHPTIGVEMDGAKDPTIRKLHLTRIRYFLYFRQRGGVLEIIALWHSARGREPRL